MRRGPWRFLILVALLVAGVAFWAFGRGPELAPGTQLVLEIRGTYVDAPVNPVLARLFGRAERTLIGALSEMSKAERDDRITSVLIEVGGLDVGWGKASELRSAIARLGDAGKRTTVYLELESLSANLEYYVATAADEIVMAPASRSVLPGLAAEYFFLGGLFEKVGVDVEYERIGRYKSAVESYAETGMSDANREMTRALLDSIDARFVGAVAEGRELAPGAVEALIDEAPSTPERLVELGLVDRVAHRDELLAEPRIDAAQWAAIAFEDVGFDPQANFALVYGSGPVVTGSGDVSRQGNPVLAADTVAQAIEDASKAEDIEAIVFRVDSPGGSPLASDIVWRAIARARDRGTPVVASFSDVAASGGYYVACGADRIVSQPTTYTGSIGVFVLRPVLGGLLDKLDIGVESMQRGKRADLLLSAEPLSPGARQVLREDVRRIYDLFVQRVAEGRGLETSEVDAVGRGRVFTGEQARDAGLVDVLGGLRDAVTEAKLLAGLDPDTDVLLMTYPPPRPLADQIAEALGLVRVAATPELPLPRGLARTLALLGDLPPGAPLLVPPGLAEIR